MAKVAVKEITKPGRPLKGNSRRVPITISTETDTVDAVDETRKKMSISRSDFYETAVKLYLAELGVTKA